MQQKQELTQGTSNLPDDFMYEEIWEVFVGNCREPFVLNEKEYAILSDAILRGLRGAIQFKDKLISIPYVQSANRTSKRLKPQYRIASPVYSELSEEQRERNRKKIAEIKKELGAKLSMEKK